MCELGERIRLAMDTLEHSYAPYSDFKVAAVLETEDGKLYTGVNVENAAYSPTNCAERTAFFKAISEGERSFRSIVIVGGSGGRIDEYLAPCGVCRQVMMEFCDTDRFRIYLAKSEEDYRSFTLGELFPEGFGPENLRGEK